MENSVIEVISTQEFDRHGLLWLVGYGGPSLRWSSPKGITREAVSYLGGLDGLPGSGPRRLEYFLEYLRHADELVAADAYNEFAEASLDEIAGLRNKLDRQWVIAQLRDASVPRHRRRLCWTFLSQCGTAADVSLFDEAIHKRKLDSTFDPGMDAAIACYISLGGEPALARIEHDYLADPDVEYLDSFAATSAIRVHGTELSVISRKRLARALRLLLSRPELADLVIPDLARWEDWTAVDRMVELFAMSTEQTTLLKPATVLYLKSCPLPAAATALDRLRAIDAQAVQSAESSMFLYSGVASVPVPPPDANMDSAGKPAPGSTGKPAPGSTGKPAPGSTGKPAPGSTGKPAPGAMVEEVARQPRTATEKVRGR